MCPSVRQILSVRPTDVRPSDRFAMGFAMGFATGFAMGFLYLPSPKGERKAPEGGHIASRVLKRLSVFPRQCNELKLFVLKKCFKFACPQFL